MSEVAELAVKLDLEGRRLLAVFEGISGSQWQVEVYADGTVWTIQNTLAHLMTAERAFIRLFEQIRQGGGGVTEDFLIDRYNASQIRKTKDMSPTDLLQSYREARSQMVIWISKLAQADLEKRGRHPYLGLTTLREMLKMIYIHNQMHARDVRRALKG